MEDKERAILVQKKWSNNLLFLILCTSLHTLVNKTAEYGVFRRDLRCAIMSNWWAAAQEKYSGALYVLSTLKFQYPTLFISWQCGVCVFLLMSAHALGYTKLSGVDRSVLRIWLPSMILHTAVMYFGSVSLSKLAIPIFIGLQNLSYVYIELFNFWKSKLIPTTTAQLSVAIIGFGAMYLFYYNLKDNQDAFKWISAYVFCSGLYLLFSEIMKDTKLSAINRIFYNSFFCVIFLTVLSIVTREWLKFFDFPFRDHGRFIFSCWLSGILYCLSSVLAFLLTKETASEVVEAGMTTGRVLVSTISVGIFEAILDAPTAFSIVMLLFGGLVYTFSKFKQNSLDEKQTNK